MQCLHGLPSDNGQDVLRFVSAGFLAGVLAPVAVPARGSLIATVSSLNELWDVIHVQASGGSEAPGQAGEGTPRGATPEPT